jgi:hypothetical protein
LHSAGALGHFRQYRRRRHHRRCRRRRSSSSSSTMAIQQRFRPALPQC